MSQTARPPVLPPSLLREFSRRSTVRDHCATTRPFRSSVPRDQRLLVSGPLYTFGKDSPCFTIPSSRHDPPPPAHLPGPGHYDPEFPQDRKIQTRIGSSRQDYTEEPLTSCIDFVYKPAFPEGKLISIGERGNFESFKGTVSPGPNFAPPSALDLEHGHAICGRHNGERQDETPGPGEYDPNFLLPRGQMFTIKGPKSRYDWLTGGSEVTPGPGDYDPREAIDRTIGTSLCGHRKRGRARSSLPMRGCELLALGPLIVRLNKVGDPDSARKYVGAHPELKELVKEIIGMVLHMKPDDPVAFVRGWYQGIKDEIERRNPKHTSEDEWITTIDDVKVTDEKALKEFLKG